MPCSIKYFFPYYSRKSKCGVNKMSNPKLDWDNLLLALKNNNVIPVIGRQLYRVDIDSKGKKNYPLYEHLAEVVSKGKTDRFPMACQKYLNADNRNRIRLSEFLKMQLQEICLTKENPLWKLARIKNFDLFINTTCDNFLVKTIKKVRRSSTGTFFYTTKDNNFTNNPNSNRDVQKSIYGCNVIFHIFGSLINKNLYIAYTEEFMVETIISFFKNIEMYQSLNINLIQRVVDSRLLFLGCEYDDWLLQYLMCLLSSNSYKNENFKLIIGDNFKNTSQDLFNQLIQFLIKQNAVEFYPAEDENFVDLLFEEIKRRDLDEDEIIQPKDFPGKVFISFEGRDRPAAQELADTLRDADVGVWLDECNLELGVKVKEEIIDAINKCTVFIPLTSMHTKKKVDKKGDKKFHIKEWEYAYSKYITDKKKYNDDKKCVTIIPVVLDNKKNIYDEFKNFYCYSPPKEEMNRKYDELIKKLKEILREYHD